MESVQRARRGLAIYFVVLLLGCTPLWINIARDGLEPSLFLPLVWTPALSSIVARLILREGFSDVSFRFGQGTPAQMVLGVVYPIAVALPAYGFAWITGMAEFAPAAVHPLGFEIPGHTPLERLLVGGIIALTVAPLMMGFLALGEEIGWRGYMLPRLVEARVPQPLLVSGAIWGLWHAPLILSGHYASGPNRLLSVVVFIVTLSGWGSLVGQMRLSTGSIWASVVLHASWNSILVSFFGASTAGSNAALWTGESGILVAISTALVTTLVLRFRPGPRTLVTSKRSQSLGAVRS